MLVFYKIFIKYPINDVPIENTPHTSYTLLFADDIVHYVIYEKKYEELEKTINLYLSHLENWMNKWRLSLAPHKCSYTIFTKNKRINNEIGFDLKLYGISIPRDNAPVFLGLRFDPFMSWTNYMDHVIKKAKERVNIIRILSYYEKWRTDKSTLVNIYISLTRSIFEYMGFIYTQLSEPNKKKICAIENNALRIIFNKKRGKDECSIDELHEMAGIPRLEIRLKDLTEKYFTKAYAMSNPIIDDLVEECKAYYNNQLIEEIDANQNVDIEKIREENYKIKSYMKSNPTTLLCHVEYFKDIFW